MPGKSFHSQPCAVSGASGYVGSIVVQQLRQTMPVIGLVRRPAHGEDIAWSLETQKDIAAALRNRGVRTLIHAAWDLRSSDPAEVKRTCVRGSEALFLSAERAGVERIVFISTISAFEGCRSIYGRAKLAVEHMLAGTRHAILRPGLVYGEHSGGVFGAIRNRARNSRVLPLIGDGRAPQYLLDEATLAESVRRAVTGEFDSAGGPITLAHPKAVPFRDLVRDIAKAEKRRPLLIPVPWRLFWAGARTGEFLHAALPFRSDSILSFVFADPQPDFTRMKALGISPAEYRYPS
ncbi:MAG: NAD-dependent epimerase/dehydratase family protein [Acidobacteriota bacterium]|nr:NAD-dependent epimerase/dehydratase family protein [Acidobacteriota bacterium]